MNLIRTKKNPSVAVRLRFLLFSIQLESRLDFFCLGFFEANQEFLSSERRKTGEILVFFFNTETNTLEKNTEHRQLFEYILCFGF